MTGDVRKILIPLAVVLPLLLAACGEGSEKTPADGPADARSIPDAGPVADGGSPDAAAEPVYGFCEPNAQAFPVRTPPTEPTTLPFLHVSGTDIVDEGGNRVALRGVNFGSWLMMENWIPGIGVLFEDDLLDMIPGKAAEFGVAELVEEARSQNILDWISEKKPHWVLVREWREYTKRHATAEEEAGVEAFWAWFDSEPWVFEERSLWRWLWGRFGFEKSEELRAAFQDHYVTELDVGRVAELGLNLIRVPIWYDALETDWKGQNGFKPQGWRRLDDIAVWARRHGVYLMLDLHGAPGGQSTAWHTGIEDGGHLWTEQACIDKTARLWKAIAAYFEDDPHVAVYDLLNEPMNFPDRDAYVAVHDALYSAIREVDAKHIVMAEDGYKPADMLASPSEMGWENAMFSVHMYPGGVSADDYLSKIETELSKIGRYYDRFNCPLFLGEFNAADGTDSGTWAAEAMDEVLSMLNQRGVHWAPWTWKFFTGQVDWGLYHPKENDGYRIDVKDAAFEKIKADFDALNSQNFEPDPALETAFTNNSEAEPQPLNLGN
ncbi:MAG: cellulase family glycosylhydrolase [Deltaproteobacteria bacterium]|nr:cellulase family glycosylhydrolase [Deltaproteobacteria bacterium]